MMGTLQIEEFNEVCPTSKKTDWCVSLTSTAPSNDGNQTLPRQTPIVKLGERLIDTVCFKEFDHVAVLVFGFYSGSLDTVDCSQTSASEVFEVVSKALSGRYIALVRIEKSWVLITDPGGAMTCVFSTDGCLAGSRPSLLNVVRPDSIGRNLGLEHERARSLTGTWYPFGVTMFEKCKCVLPNHALKLDSGEAFRIRSFAESTSDIHTATEKFHAAVRKISAQLQGKRVALALTAGQDSRLLFASLLNERANFKELICFTVSHKGAEADVSVAEQISTANGVRHITSSISQEWDGYVLIQGIGFELARTFYSAIDYTFVNRLQVTPSFLLHILGMPHTPYWLEHAEKWLAGLSHNRKSYQVMDLAYLELRNAVAQCPALYDHERLFDYALPFFSDSDLIESFLGLSPKIKRNSSFIPHVVNSILPSLRRVPFNGSKSPTKWWSILTRIIHWARIVRQRLTWAIRQCKAKSAR